MLRNIFVLSLLGAGAVASLRGPFETLLLYLWVAYFRPESWIYSSWFVAANISLLVGVYLIVRFFFSSERVRFDSGTVLLIAIVIHGALSVWQSRWSGAVLLPFENFAKSIVIAIFVSSLSTTAERFRTVLATIALSLGFEATKQGWMFLLTMPGSKNFNDIPFLGDNNAVAVGMFTLLPLVLVLAETAERRWEKYMWVFVAIGVGYRGLTTYSRGGFLAAGVLVALYIVRGRKHRIRHAIVALAASAVLLSTMSDMFWSRIETISVSEEEERDASASSRLYFWQVAVQMAKANPFLGVGHSAYNYAYDGFDTTDGEFGQGRSVHSTWFGLLGEGGFAGLGLVLLAVGRALVQSRLVYRQLGAEDPRSKMARGVQTALITFAVGGSFVAMQYNEMLWHVVGLAFALPALARVATPAVEPSLAAASLPTRNDVFATVVVPRKVPLAQQSGAPQNS